MNRKYRSLRRRVSILGLALIASLVLGGVAAGSASAATQHWQTCAKGWGLEQFSDKACNEEVGAGLGEYGARNISEGTSTAFSMTGGEFVFTWPVGGIPFKISCASQTSSEDTLENPKGGGAGTASLKFFLKTCTVKEPKGCTVAPIEMVLKGEATEFGGKPAVKFSSSSGSELFAFTLSGAECPTKLTYVFYGSFTGVMNSNGSLSFTEASSGITYAGKPASLTGTSSIEASGEVLFLGPIWRSQAPTNPTSSSSFNEVSCSSSSNCIGVGSTGSGPLAEQWNGAKWSTMTNPAGSYYLVDVSCTSSSFCFAAPNTGIGLRRWNGSEWATVEGANPAGATSSSLTRVSCTSSTFCMAVGAYTVSGGATRTLAETWNGSKWSVLSTPFEEGGANNLGTVSCESSISCTATGKKGGKSIALRWNGSEWSTLGTLTSTPKEISCAAPSSCTVVILLTGKVEHWDGSKWSLASIPAPEGGSSPRLFGISCLTTTSCTAVGSYKFEGADKTLAESWNGSEWSVQSIPSPTPGGSDPKFSGVSCTAVTTCTAVGSYIPKAESSTTLAARFE